MVLINAVLITRACLRNCCLRFQVYFSFFIYFLKILKFDTLKGLQKCK